MARLINTGKEGGGGVRMASASPSGDHVPEHERPIRPTSETLLYRGNRPGLDENAGMAGESRLPNPYSFENDHTSSWPPSGQRFCIAAINVSCQVNLAGLPRRSVPTNPQVAIIRRASDYATWEAGGGSGETLGDWMHTLDSKCSLDGGQARRHAPRRLLYQVWEKTSVSS